MALSWQQLLEAADQVGIKLEIVQGTPMWEAFPATRHQRVLAHIRESVVQPSSGSGCGCFLEEDIYIQFPDGSIKRPDISIFCQEPPIQDEALEIVSEAVVEVISKGYEKKDLEIGPPLYLSQGVKDVVVVNPYDGKVHNHTPAGLQTFDSPREITLQCGSQLTA